MLRRGFNCFVLNNNSAPVRTYLDAYASNIKAVFATSKLISTATNCIRIRRSSDNTEQIIGFNADGFMDTDALTTFLGASDGYAVWWYNQLGDGVDAVQLTEAQQPKIVLNSLNGHSGLLFDGSNDEFNTYPIFDSTFNTSFQFLTLANKASTDFRIHENIAGNQHYGSRRNTEVYYRQGNLVPINAETAGLNNGILATQLDNIVYNGTQRKIYVNDVAFLTESVSGNLGVSGAVKIGGYSSAGFHWDGHIYCKVYMNLAATETQVHEINAAVKSAYSLSINKKYYFFTGNSLTYGTGATTTNSYPGNNYPSRVVTAKGGTSVIEFVNQGVPGAPTTTITASRNYTNGFYSQRVAFVWEGTNSIATQEKTAAAAYSDMVTYLNGVRSLGWQIILLTVLPRASGFSGSVTTASFETERLAYNQLLRDNAATLCDVLCDVGADAIIGDLANINNTTYYGDQIHLTDAGYEIVASMVLTSIATL